ncbi:hypothetical protein Trydic_g6519 [Trypoxylus dichotomus]
MKFSPSKALITTSVASIRSDNLLTFYHIQLEQFWFQHNTLRNSPNSTLQKISFPGIFAAQRKGIQAARPPPKSTVMLHPKILRYLVCSKYLSAGCRGRAVLPVNAEHNRLRITQPHNHPPDNTVAEKYDFFKRLKLAVQRLPNAQLKTVFDEVVQFYPKISGEYTYQSLRSSLRRWRKEAQQ